MCQIALSKSYKKVKRIRRKNGSLPNFLVERLLDFSHYSHYCKKKLAQYFCKLLFDTFDNICDVLRAAFCDSHNVFMTLDGLGPIDNRPSTAEAPPIGKIHSFSKISVTLDTVMQFKCP